VSTQNITADDIRKALSKFYQPPEWCLGFEVGNGTGGNCTRHADAVALNMYPSRGNELRGFEIKISRSDLKHELDNGAKAEAVCKFCDTWFLVVPKGLTKDMQIPLPWGIIEYNVESGSLRIKKQAEKLEKTSITMNFVAALLRAQERAYLQNAGEIIDEGVKNGVARALANERWERGLTATKDAKAELDNIKETLAKVRSETGIDLLGWAPTDRQIKKLKLLERIRDFSGFFGVMDRTSENMKGVLKDIKSLKEEIERE